MSDALTITITPTDNGVHTEVWCPAFVDREEHSNTDDAIEWAHERIRSNGAPFVPFTDDA